MATGPSSRPTLPSDRKKQIGCAVALALLLALLVVVSYGLGLWGSGELATP
jgi:hypothetical protein